MRAFFYLLLVMAAAGCREKQPGNQPGPAASWEPKGIFEASEVMTSSNHFLLFSNGLVKHFQPDGTSIGMGWYERTNGTWIWHVFANRWEVRPDEDSLFCSEVGNPSVPWLGSPTNKFHLTRRASLPTYQHVHQ